MNKFNISTVEREFILRAIAERRRLDGREAFEYRDLKIAFGLERGSCTVDLGRTKVMAQVSCEVSAPKESRPTEGILFINVELSPMAAPYFEPGRQVDVSAEVTRLLERCLKESGCLDLESLCIQSGIKVWVIRVDLHVLNYDGNMVDALSVAAVSAMNHFRRPDVTVSGEDITIHQKEERDPLPLSIHHFPVCVTFAFFEQGKYILLDPTEMEELVLDTKLVLCMNRHREVCFAQKLGNMTLLNEQITRCKDICFGKVCEITEAVLNAIQNESHGTTLASQTCQNTEISERKVTSKQRKPAAEPSRTKINLVAQIDADSAVEMEVDNSTNIGLEDMICGPAALVADSDLEDDLDTLEEARATKGQTDMKIKVADVDNDQDGNSPLHQSALAPEQQNEADLPGSVEQNSSKKKKKKKQSKVPRS